jgi:hypothetical protein
MTDVKPVAKFTLTCGHLVHIYDMRHIAGEVLPVEFKCPRCPIGATGVYPLRSATGLEIL